MESYRVLSQIFTDPFMFIYLLFIKIPGNTDPIPQIWHFITLVITLLITDYPNNLVTFYLLGERILLV